VRSTLLIEYIGWVIADLAFLLSLNLLLELCCIRWPRRWVTCAAIIAATIVCTWSVINAGWVIRTGTQILPCVLLPVFRDPVNALLMVGANLRQAPVAAILLLGPSAVAITFVVAVLIKTPAPVPYTKLPRGRLAAYSLIILAAVLARPAFTARPSSYIASVGMRFNSQLRAIQSLVLPSERALTVATRRMPSVDDRPPFRADFAAQYNIVIVVLEGVQYSYTSLADPQSARTPQLRALADRGAEFTNTRTVLSHTTKALFALLTGRFPSVSQDLAEAVPAAKPYLALPAVLGGLGYRTAFFQSAKGNFEARPGLVHNLGFDLFCARDQVDDPNRYLGYLACDEFALLEPIVKWVTADTGLFLLTYLCSVSHDPYEVPQWFDQAAGGDQVAAYGQTIAYTDAFIGALLAELTQLGVADQTVFCVVGDHGEGFGEHGLLGHERIGFDEVLRVPFCLSAPWLIEPGRKITVPVSSVDLTPTLLGLLGFKPPSGLFDGLDVLAPIPPDRKAFFAGWLPDGPAGYVCGSTKYIYNPTDKSVSAYNLADDPQEMVRLNPTQEVTRQVAREIASWRRHSIFKIDQQRAGRTVLYGNWSARWNDRVATVEYNRR
jgi:hypothetical protein